MTVFYFSAQIGNESLFDADGVELPDAVAAKAHAVEVARELLKADQRNKRSWRLDVLDTDGCPVSTVPFASVDPSLDHLRPDLRAPLEGVYESLRQLRQNLTSLDRVLLWDRVSRFGMVRRPYLAAKDGQLV